MFYTTLENMPVARTDGEALRERYTFTFRQRLLLIRADIGKPSVAKNPDPIIIEKIGFDDNYVENDHKRHYNQIFFAAANDNLNKIRFIIISDVIIPGT